MVAAVKALALLASSVALISATGAPRVGIDPSEYPAIVRVDCGPIRGSAFFVGPHIALSVNHVTSNKGCEIAGEPVKVIHTSGDFSILYSKRGSGKWLTVDCSGYKVGRAYNGIGFARGLATLTQVEVEGTGYEKQRLALLDGVFTYIPGQSGGASIDRETGKVVGTINAYWAAYGLSGSVELKGTAVCSGASAQSPRSLDR